VSLIEAEAGIYEAIATLEFLGRPVRAADIASAAGIDADTVRRTLGSMAERGIVNRTAGDGEPAYEPTRRGWSCSPIGVECSQSASSVRSPVTSAIG